MPEKTGGNKFYGWVLLPVLCLVYSIPIGFAMYGPPVINTFMAEELKLQRWQVNVGYSMIGIVLGLGALFIPWLMNRFGPKKTLAIGAVLTAVTSILMALLGNIMVGISGSSYPVVYWIICLFVGLGISFGTVVPVQALVLLWFNVHRALAMGLVLGGGAIGGFIYPQIISNCIISFGNDWRVGWYVIALACFIGAVVALLAVKNRPEELGQHPDGMSPQQLEHAAKIAKHVLIRTYRSPINWPAAAAFKTRSIWLLMIGTAVIFFLWQALLTQTPAHLHDRGFSSSDPVLYLQPAFIYGLILAFSIVGRLGVSFLGERIESRFMMAIAALFLVAGGFLFWLASKDNLWAVYLFPVFTGIGFGATYVSIPLMVGNYFGARSFPDLMRIINPVNAIFQFSAPSVAGLMYDINHDYGMAVLLACIAGLTGAVLIYFCKPPLPDKAA
jgi:MFS family permease